MAALAAQVLAQRVRVLAAQRARRRHRGEAEAVAAEVADLDEEVLGLEVAAHDEAGEGLGGGVARVGDELIVVARGIVGGGDGRRSSGPGLVVVGGCCGVVALELVALELITLEFAGQLVGEIPPAHHLAMLRVDVRAEREGRQLELF